jgi:hypothetical protein
MVRDGMNFILFHTMIFQCCHEKYARWTNRCLYSLQERFFSCWYANYATYSKPLSIPSYRRGFSTLPKKLLPKLKNVIVPLHYFFLKKNQTILTLCHFITFHPSYSINTNIRFNLCKKIKHY